MEITENTQQIEQAELAYENLASQINSGRWGHEESEELERLADELEKLYNENETPEIDRICL